MLIYMEEMDVRMGGDDCWIFALLVESGTWGSYSMDCACCCVRNEKEEK